MLRIITSNSDKMTVKSLLNSEIGQSLRRQIIFLRSTYATSSNSGKEEIVDITSVDAHPKFDGPVVDVEKVERGEAPTNKSRLNPHHYNILHGRRPYEEDGIAHHHYSIGWKRRMFGRYGLEGSNVPAGVAWPTKEDIKLAKEYEKVAYPLSLQDSCAQIAKVKAMEEAQLQARQEELAAKAAMTSQWENQLYAKIAKKEADILAAKTRKERMMEEVRRHFGFKVDPRDERFQAMLEQKEKEDKKLRKEAKKKDRADKLMARLLAENDNASSGEDPTKTANSSKPQDLA